VPLALPSPRIPTAHTAGTLCADGGKKHGAVAQLNHPPLSGSFATLGSGQTSATCCPLANSSTWIELSDLDG